MGFFIFNFLFDIWMNKWIKFGSIYKWIMVCKFWVSPLNFEQKDGWMDAIVNTSKLIHTSIHMSKIKISFKSP